MIPAPQVARLSRAMPFWMSLLLIPVAILGALHGGWTVILLPVVTWYFFSILDAFLGLYTENADLDTREDQLTWYKAITLIWAPLQFGLLYWMIWYVTGPGDAHLSVLETIVLFFGVGVITGTVGHQLQPRVDAPKEPGRAVSRRSASGDGALLAFPLGTSAGASPPCRHPARPGDGAL